jgi:hypothetical protein
VLTPTEGVSKKGSLWNFGKRYGDALVFAPPEHAQFPESDFAVVAQTPPRQLLFRDRASAKKHPRFRKDASEPENRETRLSPFASSAAGEVRSGQCPIAGWK